MAIQKTDKIWHNGKLINWEDATIHVMSHVVHYGSSVFEGIRCYAPPSGPAIFRATEHIQRLVDSAKVYRIDVPFTRDEIIKGMLEMVGHNGLWPCYVRPIILRGYGEAGVNPFNSPTEVYIINYPWGKYLGGEQEGCDVCVSFGRGGSASIATMVRSGLSSASNESSAQRIGAPPVAGVTTSRARPMSRMFPARPCGHEVSMLEVRRAEPAARSGAAPADERGAGGGVRFTPAS